MSPFRYGRDFYTEEAAQQMLSASAWVCIALVGLFVAVHLLRRSAGQPISTAAAAKLSPHILIQRYQRGARLYHWGNTFLVLGLALSGIGLFSPGSLGDMSWLLVHEVFAIGFVLALALHVVVAPKRGEGRAMWFDLRDAHDLRVIAANFLGRTRNYPAFGKFDPLQKVYHALLTLLAGCLLFSGSYLFASAEAWATLSHPWLRLMRLLHDVTAFAFIAIVIGHVYFGVIRVNWPQLVSMLTGRLRGSSFNRYHDADRWRPRDDQF